MKNIIALAAAAAALAGCSENTPVQTVDWYKANEAERTAMISKCKANPGQLEASPNCINAVTAANHLAIDKRSYTKRVPINVSAGGK